MTEDEAIAWANKKFEPATVSNLHAFVAMLREESERQNLVSARSLEEVWVRHIVDSAQLLGLTQVGNDGTWLDIGSGAGLPGLVIAICNPGLSVVLAEPRKRRVQWLRHVIAKLGLEHCRVEEQRIERIAPFSASVISARAVAPLNELLSWGGPFSTPRTTWLLPKGRNALQELEATSSALRKMFHVKHSLTDENAGIIVGRGKVGRSEL